MYVSFLSLSLLLLLLLPPFYTYMLIIMEGKEEGDRE
jgi:hypothetical protein